MCFFYFISNTGFPPSLLGRSYRKDLKSQGTCHQQTKNIRSPSLSPHPLSLFLSLQLILSLSVDLFLSVSLLNFLSFLILIYLSTFFLHTFLSNLLLPLSSSLWLEQWRHHYLVVTSSPWDALFLFLSLRLSHRRRSREASKATKSQLRCCSCCCCFWCCCCCCCRSARSARKKVNKEGTLGPNINNVGTIAYMYHWKCRTSNSILLYPP